MKKNKRKNTIMVFLILLLAITVGFAALATTLKINGSTNITKQTWDIYWDNASIVPTTNLANENITTGAQTKTNDSTTLEWAVNLNIPGDYYEFTVDAVNNGTIDAMITGIDSKIGNESIISTVNGQLVVDTSVIPSYLNYTITYSDGTPLALKHLLKKKKNGVSTREKYKVRVEFDRDLNNDDLDDISSGGEELTFTFNVTYGQADDTAVNRKGIETCPNCVFTFYTDTNYFKENDYGEDAEPVENYTDDYKTLTWSYYIDEWDYLRLDPSECIGECTYYENQQRNVFLGHVLDSDDKIEKAYVCQVRDNITYCIEGAYNPMEDDLTAGVYTRNRTLLQSADIFNNTCDEWTTYEPTTLSCGDYGGMEVLTNNFGDASITGNLTTCSVSYQGSAICSYNNQ